MKFKTILADPPWQQPTMGRYALHKHHRPDSLPYATMTLDAILGLPVADLADDDAHCWLWTTNAFLHAGFHVLEAWGFKYLNALTWAKPSGAGNYFIGRTQVCLFGYKGKCRFKERYKPNVLHANPGKHSQKPEASYELIEAMSFAPRIELFARRTRPGWATIGDGIDGTDINTSITRASAA